MCACVCVCVCGCLCVCVLRGGGLSTVSEQRAGGSHRQGRVASSGGSGRSVGSGDLGSEGVTLDGPTPISVSFFPKGSVEFRHSRAARWGFNVLWGSAVFTTKSWACSFASSEIQIQAAESLLRAGLRLSSLVFNPRLPSPGLRGQSPRRQSPSAAAVQSRLF